MFKVKNKDTRTGLLAPTLTYFTPYFRVSIVDFKHVVTDWVVSKVFFES